MSQYFLAVNKTRKEYVCAFCLGCSPNLVDWALDQHSGVFALLLRCSSRLGARDYLGPRTEILDPLQMSPEEIAEADARGVPREAGPCAIPADSVIGSWAGGEVYLVGDSDSSGLFDLAYREYRNIGLEVVEAYNQMVPKFPLRLDECRCQKGDDDE
jgi:hypothetical protein